MAERYFITGDIVGADAPNYGEKRVELGTVILEGVYNNGNVKVTNASFKDIYELSKKGPVFCIAELSALGTVMCDIVKTVNVNGSTYTITTYTNNSSYGGADDYPVFTIQH